MKIAGRIRMFLARSALRCALALMRSAARSKVPDVADRLIVADNLRSIGHMAGVMYGDGVGHSCLMEPAAIRRTTFEEISLFVD